MKHYYKVIGKTTEGKLVISGTFQMFDTTGMPLSIMFTLINKQNMIPDPIDFYESAINAGWEIKTIFNRLEEAYLDSFDKHFWLNVRQRLIFYIKNT